MEQLAGVVILNQVYVAVILFTFLYQTVMPFLMCVCMCMSCVRVRLCGACVRDFLCVYGRREAETCKNQK